MARPFHLLKPFTPWGSAVVGALLGLLLATFVFAPARWLAAGVNEASGGQIMLTDARGTVWTGSALLALSGGVASQSSVSLPGRVDWRMRPSASGSGVAVTTDVNATCCMAQALQLQTSPRWGGALMQVANHTSNWPAGLLAGLGTPWNTIQAQGQLALSTQGLSVEWASGNAVMQGSVQLDALDMASRLSTLKPMGSYRLTLNGGTVNKLQLETLQGSLQLTGSGQWVGGRLRFDGVASSTPERQDALSNLLNIIGRRSGARAIIKVG